MVTINKTSFKSVPDCIIMRNELVELVITTTFGPRILYYGFIGGRNMFKIFDDQLSESAPPEWLSYGGHRLWHAPEVFPRTYYPDNEPVPYEITGNTILLDCPEENTNHIKKQLQITLAAEGTGVTLKHVIKNTGVWSKPLAAWCLSVMAPGGRAIIPQEDYKPHPDCLVPARPLVLWHFTRMNDPRYVWGDRYIQLIQDPAATSKQKIGVANTKGWAAYYLEGDLFIKRYPYDPDAVYTDMGCNTELYTEAGFLEVETLSPLKNLAPGESLEHTEIWSLHSQLFDGTESSCAAVEALV